ncbi:hypothetical protein FE257_009448 [Aspergillus nanangensis]|uniref:Uncharacterized protein n=1 Tax=Aspergillus nanangensis TaxID=2582783 RepID=A0AAD4CK52_ASPNN|nr:hypothetical protein FE257_009448 [Aspergillus nanangensis]
MAFIRFVEDLRGRMFEDSSEKVHGSYLTAGYIMGTPGNGSRNSRDYFTAILCSQKKYFVKATLCKLGDLRATVFVVLLRWRSVGALLAET